MKRYSPLQLAGTVAGSAIFWAIVALLCLCVGSTGAFAWPARDVLMLRLEVVLMASLVGAALASAGVVYQAILRNPLADPYLLGVSTGAALGGYLWRLQFVTALAAMVGSSAEAFTQQGFAFLGALLAVSVVFVLSSRRGRIEPITLLLVGVIVNAVNVSVFLLINAIHRDLTASSGGVMTFLVGGLQTNLTLWQQLSAASFVAAGWIVLMYLAGQLNVATLGEGEAIALGVRIHRLRWIALIVASLVTASAVAISGPIGFIGLVCPHLSRLVVGNDQRRLLPVATAVGAALLASADALARRLSSETLGQTLLPVGVLTALLGGPFFLLLLWQSRRRLLV